MSSVVAVLCTVLAANGYQHWAHSAVERGVAFPTPAQLVAFAAESLNMPETTPEVSDIRVRVTTYRLARLRAGQAMLPFVVVASILARRSLDPISVGIAVLVQLATVIIFLRARRRLGWVALNTKAGKGSFGSELVISREKVRNWTVVDTTARVYCSDASLRLDCGDQDAAQLRAMLRGWLGAPTSLERRGSRRARLVALTAAVVGLVLAVAAFAYDSVPLVLVGLPCFVAGLALFGALSQRVARS